VENERTVSRRVVALLVFLWFAGSVRALLLWSHDPLHAYANSYDQTRYTSCFGFHPDRPLAIPPQTNSPQSPFSDYRFLPVETPFCYWSSELVFTGATAAIWHAEELVGRGEVHDVRWVGALRWLALLALSIGLSRAWLRRGDVRAAIANAALMPLVFADPGNTMYLDTFYAEWTALLAAYATIALALLWRDDARSRRRFALLALVAFALAASKIQHLVLPLGLAAVVFLLDRARSNRTSWRALALAIGAFAGLSLQVVQLQREGPLMEAIDQYNRADVLFTALLPFADDKRALLEELHVDPDCAKYVGLHAWELPDLPERVCRGLDGFRRAAELRTLATHPRIAFRLAGHGVLALDPWIAKNLGQIEGIDFATIPALPSIGRLLHAWPWLQLALLAAPFAGLVLLSRRPGWRRGARAFDFTALVVVTMLGTLAVTILGDGLADTGKQGHLIVNAALAWLCVVILFGVARVARRATSVHEISSG
jgi:hypothetical protein